MNMPSCTLNKADLLQKLDTVSRLASGSKWQRLWHNPAAYFYAILYRTVFYPLHHRPKLVEKILFFGEHMTIALPSSTDLYLTGAKSHDSEIRLARFLIHTLQPGQQFLDIGAHIGYFSLLASHLIGPIGKVLACEPSSDTFLMLKNNTGNQSTIKAINTALADYTGNMTFYEFSSSHSEYNAADISQYADTDWLKKNPPRKQITPCTSLTQLCSDYQVFPNIIKMDVEGAESTVIRGGRAYLETNNPFIVMEYHPGNRNNPSHNLAADLLLGMGYQCSVINNDGKLETIPHPAHYFRNKDTDSDNLVFNKP